MAAPSQPSVIAQFLPLIIIFVAFYFLMIRPQNKKQKEHKKMLDALRRGDKIILSSGIQGIISQAVQPEDVLVTVEIAPKTEVKVVRSAINNVISADADVKDVKVEPVEAEVIEAKDNK